MFGVGSAALVPAVAQAQPSAAERAAARQMMDDGKALFKKKRYDEAARKFLQAYQLDSSLKTALYNRAFALRKGGNLTAARTAYLEFIAIAPDDNDGLFGLAETNRQLGNKADALRLFTEYAQREKRPQKQKYLAYAKKKIAELQAAAEGRPAPTSAGPRKVAGGQVDPFTAGDLAYRQGRYLEAADHYSKAYVADKTRVEALYRRALALRKAKAYPDAVKAYLVFLRKDPKNLDGVFGLAETNRLAGNKADAKKYFEEYLQKEQRKGREKYVAYAKKQLKLLGSEPPAKVKAAVAVSAADKAKAQGLYQEAKAAYKAKKYKDAAGLYLRAHEVDPNLAKALYRAGLAHRKDKNFVGARAAYGQYLEQKPNDPDGHYGMAETARLQNDVPKAREHFQRYIELETRESEAKYVQKAKDYLIKTEPKPEAGEAAVAKAETHDEHAGHPHTGPIAAGAGKGHRHLGSDGDLHSSEFADRVTVDGLVRHGRTALAGGSPERAAKHFALAIALVPDDPLPYYLHGKALEQMGKIAEARRRYGQVVEMAPKSSVAAKARQHLDQGGGTKDAGGPRTVSVVASQSARAGALLEEAKGSRKSKELDVALERLEEASRIDPGNVDVYLEKGAIHIERGRGLPALRSYQRALALDPHRAAPLYGIAQAYELAGEKRVSLHHYRLYARSSASDVDPALKRKAFLKIEGVQWPLE